MSNLPEVYQLHVELTACPSGVNSEVSEILERKDSGNTFYMRTHISTPSASSSESNNSERHILESPP